MESRNPHAAISKSLEIKLKQKAQAITYELLPKMGEDDKEMFDLLVAANRYAQDITSTDLPDDNVEDEALVLMVQNKANEILAEEGKPWLLKIIEVAAFSKKMSFGNCMEKAFFGFATMLYNLNKHAFDTQAIPSLSLHYFNNHFVAIIDGKFFMDPWLDLAFPLSGKNDHSLIKKVFEGFGEFTHYFTLNSDAYCYSGVVTERAPTVLDRQSSYYTQNTNGFNELIALLQKESCFDLPASAFSRKRKRQEEEKPATSISSPTTQQPSVLFPPLKREKLDAPSLSLPTLDNQDTEVTKVDGPSQQLSG